MDPPWNQTHWEPFTPLGPFSVPSNNRLAQPEQQSQPYIGSSLTEKSIEARKYTGKDWDTHRPEITRLYKDGTLPAVMEFMREEHGLDATAKQYKDRFAKWGIEKSIRPKEMKAMLRKKQERAPKSSAFRLRGKEVTAKVNRYIKEHPIQSSTNIDRSVDRNINSAPTPGAISCYTPSDTGPLTPDAAPSPQASSVPHAIMNLASSYRSLYSGSYQFGDPAPTLPSSPLVFQMTSSTDRQPLSPMPIATSPTPSAPNRLSEIVFTGQSPAPFSVPSTPQQQDHDMMQDGGIGALWNEKPQTIHLFDEHVPLSIYAKSSPFSQLLPGPDSLQDYHSGEGDVFGIASGVTAGPTTMPLSEVYAAMILSVDDALVIDQYVVVPAQPGILESMHGIAEMLFNQGRYQTAEQIHRQILQLRGKELGLEHPDTLKSMHELAVAIRCQGRYQVAEKMHQQTLQLRDKLLGLEHPDTLKSMHDLAIEFCYQGRYKAAERMQQQVLDGYEKVLGKDDPETLKSMYRLAITFRKQGRYKTAERMQRQVLDGYDKVLGNEHPDTLASLNNLALVLYNQGNYKVAEEMYRQKLSIKERVLGKEHPSTLASLNNLALVLYNQGNYKVAEEMYRQQLSISGKVLGKEHPSTLTSLNNLALVLYNQGNYKVAEEMYRQQLSIKERVLGKEHPSTLASLNNLALVLYKQGNYKAAEEMHRQKLNISEKVLGKEHPSTLVSLNNLALVLHNQGNYKAAEEMHQQALNISEKVLGKEHPNILNSLNNLASVLYDQGNYKAAEEMYRRSVAGSEKVLGLNHPRTKARTKSYLNILDQMKAKSLY